jgi:dimethylaniline monooxygenase (N-oxide forming)
MDGTKLKKPHYDVIVLGAGWSGLMAAKYCIGEGLRTLVVEGRDILGGVWAYTDDRRCGGVMRNTRTTSSRCLTEISDFPMPADYPDFPSHSQVFAYLKSYCARFGLDEHIRLGHPVSDVRKMGDVWHVRCENGSEFAATNVIVSCGVHQHPNDVSGAARFTGFSGTILHSAAVKSIPEDFAGKTVVIWGGGESASDIAREASLVADRVYWCIPNGQWFVPRTVDRWVPFPSWRRKVVDHTSSRIRLLLSPTHMYSPLITQYFAVLLGFNGHGQEPWRTDAPYNRSFFNKSSEVMSRVRLGQIIPKRDVIGCRGQTVSFSDGSSVDAQVIITCSGYRAVFPFFSGAAAQAADPRAWYKYTIHNDDPSLAFVGFVRPIVGSIPGIAELQSRYVSLVFAGRRRLPPPSERASVILSDAAFWNYHFRFTSLRLGGLVDHFVFCKQLAKLIGCCPRYGHLLLKSPVKWWKAVSSPWNGCQFWLNDESQHVRIFRTLEQYRDNQMSEVYAFIITAPVLPILALCSHLRVLFQEYFHDEETRLRGTDASGDVRAGVGASDPGAIPQYVHSALTQPKS